LSLSLSIDVSVPSEFGLPYEELILDTPDHVKVRAFLLVQRKELAVGENGEVVHSEHGGSRMSDGEVRGTRLFQIGMHY
jgi:abhydrolase domain-containing protein 13